LFVYTGNSPINRIDPKGKNPLIPLAIAAGLSSEKLAAAVGLTALTAYFQSEAGQELLRNITNNLTDMTETLGKSIEDLLRELKDAKNTTAGTLVPSGPGDMASPDLSGTPEACGIRFQLCLRNADSMCHSVYEKIRCFLVYIGCMFNNLGS
jgi:hypothetical protein